MKKVFSAVLCAVLLVSMFAFPALADGTPRFFLTGPASVDVGSEIEIVLNVEGEYQAHIINVLVEFDNASFSYVGKKNGDAYIEMAENGAVGTCELTMNGKAVSFAVMMLSDAASSEGELVKLRFKALSTAAEKTEFKAVVKDFSYMPVGSKNSTPIECTSSNLSVVVVGGSGTTPTDKPIGKATDDPNPGESQDPNATDKPGPDISKNTPDPNATADPNATPDPNATDDPNPDISKQTTDPDATNEPGSGDNEGRNDGWLKYLLIAVGGTAAAVLIGFGIYLVARKDRKEN